MSTNEPRRNFSTSSQVALILALKSASASPSPDVNQSIAEQKSKSRAIEASARAPSHPRVTATHLLAGICLSHPHDAEPLQLLHYFGISPDVLYTAVGLTPEVVAYLQREQESLVTQTPTIEAVQEVWSALDPEAERVVAQAIDLAQQYNSAEGGLVQLRYLFGGIVVQENEGRIVLASLLAIAGPNAIEQLALHYPDYLAASEPLTTWIPIWFRRRISISDYDADLHSSRDLVGIGAEVDAFAYLIAAKSLTPPLAVGLFGDWGSGKSFFMEAMRSRINEITENARTSTRPQRDLSIYKHVVQIEFNAWQYVEGNLWASLMEHILRNLKTRAQEAPSLVQLRQQEWIAKLEAKRQEEKEAQTQKVAKEEELQSKKADIDQLERERDATLKALEKLTASDLLHAIQLDPVQTERLNKTLKEFGVEAMDNSGEEFVMAFRELHAELQRSNALLTPLRAGDKTWLFGLIAALISGPLVSLILTWLSDNQIPSVTNALTGLSVLLSSVAVYLRQGAQWLSKARLQVEQAQGLLNQKHREVEAEYDRRIAEAKQTYNQAEANYLQAKNEEQTLMAAIQLLEVELKQITPGRVLTNFIAERVGSEDYRKFLGLTALIRTDFGHLSQLIEAENQRFIEEDTGQDDQEQATRINRIVLYIDDLDRCPPHIVVKVLQAVHLLLAFPLFVVVVAVDARWLSQSLQSHYRQLLGGSRGGSVQDGDQATPQDYLEKIFQVPFRIRPLPTAARLRMVRGLLASSLVRAAPPPSSDVPFPDIPPPDAPAPEDLVTWDAHALEQPFRPNTGSDSTPAALETQIEELQFMGELQMLLGTTPRAVKRYINVYRLIKAMALARGVAFVDDAPDAPYKLVLFLLSVLTGMPTIFRELARQLPASQALAATNGENPAVHDPAPPVPVAPGSTLQDVLAALRAESRNVLAWEDEMSHDLTHLEQWLGTYAGGAWLQLPAGSFAGWAAQAGRFSFQPEEL